MNRTQYRFFVSYCEKDKPTAKAVVDTLKSSGHYVKEMSQLPWGQDFAENIRQWIDWSHFFIPVITEESKNRPWVHQEIGYALGRHIPLVPIVFRCSPEKLAFLDAVQALVESDECKLKTKLQETNWRETIGGFKGPGPLPISACDSDAAFRSRLLAEAATKINRNFPESHMRIRQCSRLTSFSLPLGHDEGYWRLVGNRGDLFWLQAEEREALQTIADKGTCDLRIDPNYYEFEDGRRRLFRIPPCTPCNGGFPKGQGYDAHVQLARLETLGNFLTQKNDENVRVVVDDEFASSESVTIIGDHWSAFSAAVAPFVRFRKTIWTWHAPTVTWDCEEFDKNFEVSLNKQQSTIRGKSSRDYAIDRITQAMEEIMREFNLQ